MRSKRLQDIIGVLTFAAIMVSIPWERLEGHPFIDVRKKKVQLDFSKRYLAVEDY